MDYVPSFRFRISALKGLIIHNGLIAIYFWIAGIGSKLEKIVYDLWMDPETEANFTNWQFGSFNPNEVPFVRVLGFHTEPSISGSWRYFSIYFFFEIVIKN